MAIFGSLIEFSAMTMSVAVCLFGIDAQFVFLFIIIDLQTFLFHFHARNYDESSHEIL